MKKQVKLYNVLFPVWLLWLFPQILVIVLPGNLLIDCLVLFCVLCALKHTRKGAVVKALWWKFWLLGFAADLVGTVWMVAGWFGMAVLDAKNLWAIPYINLLRPWLHPLTFLWTLTGIAIAGVCIYFFDKRAMKKCGLLTDREKHTIALTMAIVTAPWLFFLPIY